MKEMKVNKWKAKDNNGNDADDSLLNMMNVLINNKKPEDFPKGLDNFRMFSRLSKAFEKAEQSGILQLEDVDYKFIKDSIVNDIPAVWGMNKNIVNALEEFMSAKDIQEETMLHMKKAKENVVAVEAEVVTTTYCGD